MDLILLFYPFVKEVVVLMLDKVKNHLYLFFDSISKIQKIAEILKVDISQILNFDVSQIFNVSNNNVVQGLGAKAENMNFHREDDYKEKYIKMLEEENRRLKANSKTK